MTKLTWVATRSGTWTTPGNWSPSQVPGAADDVLFDGSGADLSFVRTQTVNTLTLDDPTTLLSVSGLLTVLDDLMINAGTLSVDSGANAVLTNFSNQGTIILASGGSLTATGSYTTDSVERIGGAGGNLILGGTLDNIGNTLTLGSVVPRISGLGTIVGGTVVGTVPLVFATFDGVTVDGSIAIQGSGTLTVNNGLVVRSADGSRPGTISYNGGGVVQFSGDQTLENVVVNFWGGAIRADGTLLLGTTATWQNPQTFFGRAYSLNGTGPASTIINDSSIDFEAGPISDPRFPVFSDLNVNVARFENNGVLSVSDPLGGIGRIAITSTSFTNAAGGLLSTNHVRSGTTRLEITVSGTTEFTNNGSIFANGGSIDLAPTLLGSGEVRIANSGTVDLHYGADAEQTVIFGDRGVLELENAALFAGTITGVTQNTSIVLNVSATAIAYTSNVLTMRLGGGQTFGLTIVGDNLTLDDFIVNTGTASTSISTDVVASCFVTGTRIWTDIGEVPVETLQIGDRVQLVSGAAPRPIVWIGQRHVACATHPNPRQVWPVRIAANAFAPDQPARDLFLSPDHALFIDDELIPMKHPINDQTITQVPTETVTYYHVELASHDVILAEGLPVESYLDTGDRTSFANADMVTTLFPTFGPQVDHNLVREAHAIAPIVVSGPILQAVRRRLAPGLASLVTAEAEPRRLTRRQSPHRGTPLKQPQQHPHRTPAL